MDTSFSQYSYGKLQLAKLEGRTMPDPAGYDHQGNLSCDPAEVLRSRRLISMGKWKGSSIAMLLDLIASVSSFGYSSAAIAAMEGDDEKACSQTFIVINPFALGQGRLRLSSTALTWCFMPLPLGADRSLSRSGHGADPEKKTPSRGFPSTKRFGIRFSA